MSMRDAAEMVVDCFDNDYGQLAKDIALSDLKKALESGNDKEKLVWTSLTPAEIYDLMPHKEPPGIYNSTDILNVVRAAEAELRKRNGQAQ